LDRVPERGLSGKTDDPKKPRAPLGAPENTFRAGSSWKKKKKLEEEEVKIAVG